MDQIDLGGTPLPAPQPPLTALELLDGFDIHSPRELLAQLRIDTADDRERRSLDKLSVLRWKGKAS
jgi:hypothetical protein